MKSFFDDDEYTIDVKSCIDVILYIQAMHPRLGLFMRQAQCLATIEDFCFLTEDGETIEPQYFPYHKFKEDDVLYIAPLIAGAGGRTGMIVAIVALVAIDILFPNNSAITPDLSKELAYDWSVMDTYDSWFPSFDHPVSKRKWNSYMNYIKRNYSINTIHCIINCYVL